jgi:hypothetical protein
MNKQFILRVIFIMLVAFGIFVIYFNMVTLRNFEILTNPDGPDTTDYFLGEE